MIAIAAVNASGKANRNSHAATVKPMLAAKNTPIMPRTFAVRVFAKPATCHSKMACANRQMLRL